MAVVERDYPAGREIEDIGREISRGYASVRNKAQELGLKWGAKPFTVKTQIPSPNRPLGDILAEQASRFHEKRARAHAKKGIEIELTDEGPYGILFFGDPHADDDGCDIEKLAADLQVVQTEPHVHGVNMGDLTNNWIRVLGHLYSHQHTTDDEAEALMDWLVGSIPWLFVILGNHDKWGPLAARICREKEVTYVSHGAMFRIKCGDSELVIDARHDHPGRSMYNPSHGQLKKGYRGSDAHIIIGAHIHTSGVTITKNEVTGHINHAVRVAAYKKFDEYADMKGFGDGSISPSILAVIDPKATAEGFVTLFHDIQSGVKFLNALRG